MRSHTSKQFWGSFIFKKPTAKLRRILMSNQQPIQFSFRKKTHTSSQSLFNCADCEIENCKLISRSLVCQNCLLFCYMKKRSLALDTNNQKLCFPSKDNYSSFAHECNFPVFVQHFPCKRRDYFSNVFHSEIIKYSSSRKMVQLSLITLPSELSNF